MPAHLTINDQRVPAPAGESIFDLAEQADVRVPTSCRKNGRCRECLVEVVEGAGLLTRRRDEESHLSDPFRLACCTRIADDPWGDAGGGVVCRTMRRGALVITDSGMNLNGADATEASDPAVTRRRGEVLIDGEAVAQSGGPILGVAVDLGTTTIVMRLIDLESGQTLGSQSFENPQRFGGSDVMARIQYDTDYKGRLLQRTLLGYMGRAIEAFDCDPNDIYEVIVVGNSTMRDLFFGLDVYGIGQRPYQSITEKELLAGERTTTSLVSKPRRLQMPINAHGRVVGLPLIHGHVGADTAACLLAINIAEEEGLVALMDIGTNTELVVGNKHRMLAASCPAGPAFEGGAIACGMPGLPGAIESIRIHGDGSHTCRSIADAPPQGICGSGLVQCLGELIRTDRINEYGRYTDESDRFVLDTEHNIYLCEEDISQLAQAKGANVAGLKIVLNHYGADFEQLDRFYLAGGFAQHLDLDAARRMGLIPNLPDEKIVKLGNAAIEGAALALKSAGRRQQLERLVPEIGHVELETDEHFFDHFVEGCQFIPVHNAALPDA